MELSEEEIKKAWEAIQKQTPEETKRMIAMTEYHRELVRMAEEKDQKRISIKRKKMDGSLS